MSSSPVAKQNVAQYSAEVSPPIAHAISITSAIAGSESENEKNTRQPPVPSSFDTSSIVSIVDKSETALVGQNLSRNSEKKVDREESENSNLLALRNLVQLDLESPNLRVARIFQAAITRAFREEKECEGPSYGTKDSKCYDAYVDIHTVEEYAKMRIFLSEDQHSGFAINVDTIVSVFKNKLKCKSAVLDTFIPKAIELGGVRLDCYNGFLPPAYLKYGFTPVAKLKFNPELAAKNWNYSRDKEPDVIFMIYNSNTGELKKSPYDIREKFVVNALQKMNYASYDEAIKEQERLLALNKIHK